MKKSILAALMLLVAATGAAQTLDEIYTAFRDKPGVEYTAISSKFIMDQMKAQMKDVESFGKDGDEKIAALKKLDSIIVLNLDGCEKSLIGKFEEMTANLKALGYEVLVNTSEDGERTTILCRMDDEGMTELLVRNIEDDEAQLVRLTGRFKKEDWNKIVGNN